MSRRRARAEGFRADPRAGDEDLSQGWVVPHLEPHDLGRVVPVARVVEQFHERLRAQADVAAAGKHRHDRFPWTIAMGKDATIQSTLQWEHRVRWLHTRDVPCASAAGTFERRGAKACFFRRVDTRIIFVERKPLPQRGEAARAERRVTHRGLDTACVRGNPGCARSSRPLLSLVELARFAGSPAHYPRSTDVRYGRRRSDLSSWRCFLRTVAEDRRRGVEGPAEPNGGPQVYLADSRVNHGTALHLECAAKLQSLPTLSVQFVIGSLLILTQCSIVRNPAKG